MTQNKMAKLHIHYTPDGKPHADHNATAAVEKAWNLIKGTEQEKQFNTSNEVVILAARVLVKKGIIPHEEILFHHEGQTIHINAAGKIDHWPMGFCDIFTNFLTQLL